MKSNIRVCLGRYFRLPSVQNGRIVGPVHLYRNFYYKNIFKDYNCTLIDRPVAGGLIPGSEASDGTFLYNGCLGSIQSNESDYTLDFVSQPVIGKNLSMGGMYGSATSLIISAYNPEVNSKKVTILSSLVSSTPTEMKLLFLVVLLLFYLLLYATYSRQFIDYKTVKIKELSLTNCFFIIFGCVFKQYSCFENKTEKLLRIRGILMLLIIFTFLFMQFVCCLIKTDQVVYAQPKTITSYQDILDSNGKTVPMFMGLRPDYQSFQMSSEGSKRKQIWNRISRGNHILNSFIIQNRVDRNRVYDGLINQTIIVLIYSNSRLVWSTNICFEFIKKNYSNNVLMSIDPSESEFAIKSVMKRTIQDFEGNVNRFKKVDDTYNAFLEMGLHEKAHMYQAFSGLKGKPVPKGIQDKLGECMSNVVQTPHPEFSNKKMKEFSSLYICFIIAMSACILVLLIEIIINEIGLNC